MPIIDMGKGKPLIPVELRQNTMKKRIFAPRTNLHRNNRRIQRRLSSYVRSTNGKPLPDALPLSALTDKQASQLRPIAAQLASASREQAPVYSVAIETGKVVKAKGKATLFAVVAHKDQSSLRFWSRTKGIPLGQTHELDHLGYVKCCAVEILGDGTSLPLFQTGWLIDLWHTVPKFKLSS